MKKIAIILIFLVLLLIFLPKKLFMSEKGNVITIYCDKELGGVNRKIFGNNIIAYDPATYEKWTKEFYGYSDYGAGIWDPRQEKSVQEVMDLAKDAGISMLRFPGGCGTHDYNWKNVVGKDRKQYLFGLDEFLEVCRQAGAEPIFTLSYFSDTPQDAAELVEYSGIKYYEIGNEIYHGNHKDIKKVLPEDYAQRYLEYYAAMKAVNPSIKIGAVLYSPSFKKYAAVYLANWNKRVLEIIKDKIDFGIMHIYPTPRLGKELEKIEAVKIFGVALAMPVLIEEPKIKRTLEVLKENSGKDIPIAMTEYNAGFVQNKPVPYRHCLGTALINAELIRIFLKPKNRILMANYWQFCNGYWGMASNGFKDNPDDLYKPYYKRPNYYVFELYNKHFGDVLVETRTQCPTYDATALVMHLQDQWYKPEGGFDFKNIPYLSVNASKSADGKKLYLIVVNKYLFEPVSAKIKIKGFSPKKHSAWVLNGPSIDATNEVDHGTVIIRQAEIKGSKFTFEPHSITAIEYE